MTVKELRAELKGLPDDLPVKVANGERWTTPVIEQTLDENLEPCLEIYMPWEDEEGRDDR